MQKISINVIKCFLILLPALLTSSIRAQESGGFKSRDYNSPAGGRLPYGLFIPHSAPVTGNTSTKAKYPLVLFLHGAGERGTDNKSQLRDILPWTKPEVQAKYPCYILAPQCPNWREVFQVYGFNTDLAITTYRNYEGSAKSWKHYSIQPGNSFTGKVNWLFFMNDDWGKETPLDSVFRNVRVFEQGEPSSAVTIHFDKLISTPYAGGGRGSNPSIEDSGATIHLVGDTRRKVPFNYVITKKTVLEFDFKSNKQGNIHGIGFDDDDKIFENKWVQTDWSASADSMPVFPSAPLRMAMELLPGIEKEFSNIDTNRIYITGLSMGGFGTWDALARHPEMFAAAVPICGGGDMETVRKFAQIPIWDFHGHDDYVVQPQRSRNMIAALSNFGAIPHYTEYSNTGHDAWKKAYEDPDLLSWLFSQKRDTTPPSTPTNVKASVIGSSRVDISWGAAFDPESGIKEYRIYRDGGEFAITNELHFSDTTVNENEVHDYRVSAVNGWWLESVKSVQAWSKITADIQPPKILFIEASGNSNTILVMFDKPVKKEQAERSGSYLLDGDLQVEKAHLAPDRRLARLTTNEMIPHKKYSLRAAGIVDTTSHQNKIAGGTEMNFSYDPELIGYWRFEEGDGATSEDYTGFENTVALREVEWVRGKYGRALGFDGQTEHVAWVRNSQRLELTDGFSVSLWFKKTPGLYSHQTIIARNHYYNNRTQFILDMDETQRIRAIVGTPDKGDLTVIGARIDALRWHHIAMTYGLGTVELFIDGVSQGKSGGGGGLINLAETIMIGGGYQGRDPFKGAIDEVRIYNRALNTSEVQALAK